MGITPKNWNKAVQKNGLFGSIKTAFTEEGLINNARTEALEAMEKKANLTFKNSIGVYEKNAAANVGTAAANNTSGIKDIQNTKSAFVKESAKNSREFNEDVMESASPWKNTLDKHSSQVRSIAATNATLKNPSAGLSNADELLELYNSALSATKRQAKVRAVGNTVKNYYAAPFKDGRTAAGIARAGTTAVGVGAAGAITYSLSGGGNKSYTNNNGNGSYDY